MIIKYNASFLLNRIVYIKKRVEEKWINESSKLEVVFVTQHITIAKIYL